MCNRITTICLLLFGWIYVHAELPEYTLSVIGNGSTGDFAPYMIGSWNHGRITQRGTALLDASMYKQIDLNKRFSYSYAVELITGYGTRNEYDRWSPTNHEWGKKSTGPSAIWVQQAYADFKYRGVFITVGAKEHQSALLNNQLSSGDLIESGNSRPIPEIRAGFIDFQNIPFTNGWVQIQGEISYGKMMDNDYLKNHFNYYDYHLNLGAMYSYKRCYFRTKPSERFSMTIGMQVGAMYGGETSVYSQGKKIKEYKFSSGLKTMVKMFLPMGENGEDYYTGSSLGSWDLHLRYTLPNNSQICAYLQKPWEDGSGIGLRNKTDGLWGLEYKAAKSGILTGVVFEYIDFRDQSGPIHWSPGDFNHTTITTEATGRDNYYNNTYYNSYANYGMAIGTPFLVSPLYNLNGFPGFIANRANGFHMGATGQLSTDVGYRALLGYQRALGTYNVPFSKARTCTSLMVEAIWKADVLMKGLSMKCQIAMDCGKLRGNNFGTCVSLAYTGLIK